MTAPRSWDDAAVAAYRRAVLLLAVAGLLAAVAADVLTVLAAGGAGLALLLTGWTPLRRRAAVPGGVLLLAGAGLATPTPPAVVATGLAAVLLVVSSRPPLRSELDAAAVAAVGLAVVTASAALSRAAAAPLALCALLLVALLWHRQRMLAGHPPRRAQRRTPRGLLAATTGLLAVGLLATPAPAGTGLHSSLFTRHGGGGTQDGPIEPGSYDTDELSLDVRGTLSTAPALAVTADSPSLWRGAVYATYDGHLWQIATGAPAVVRGTDPATVTPAPLDPLPPTPAVTVAARPLLAGNGTLYAPGVVTAVRTSGPVRAAAPGAARVPDLPYRATVHEPVLDPAALAAAHGTDPAGWTQLPAELPDRVRSLAAEIVADAPDRASAVTAVERYLRTHERYTLGAAVPAADRDSVDDFLFRSHQGFCEQFATAEIVLLRSVGVPARLATGFAGGTPTGTERVFTEADAHAWVEVAYPGLGWSTSDPTAGTELVAAHRGVLTRLGSLSDRLGRSPLLRLAAAGVLTLAALLAGGLWLLGRRGVAARRRRRRQSPVSAAFARLERRFPRPAGTTPREWLAGVPDLRPAVAVWERELFAASPPSDAEVAAAVAAVRAAGARRGRYQPQVPGPPLNGPTTSAVTQPP